MKKIILLLLIINCSSIKFTKNNLKIKTKEQILVEMAIKRYDLNIILHTIKSEENIENLIPFKNNKKLFLYFNGINNDSKHFNYSKKIKTNLLGFYHKDFNFVIYEKDNLFKLSEQKQIGVVMHEIGHALNLRHYDENCNFMISGIDSCKNYTYEQLNYLKKYLNNDLKEDKTKYLFLSKSINVENYRKSGYIDLYLIID